MTVEGASATLLEDLLHELDIELGAQGVPVDRLRRAPATKSEIRREFASIGLTAPDEALALFGWCDGFEEPGSIVTLPVFEALPLRAVSMGYKASRLGFGEWDWNPNWVQVMGDKYGLAICCTDDPAQPPLVRAVEDSAGTADSQTNHQVVSLCTPVTWWIDAMRRGWYGYDRSTHSWNSDITSIPDQIRMYRMS